MKMKTNDTNIQDVTANDRVLQKLRTNHEAMWNNSGTRVVHQQQMNDHGTDMGKQTNQQRVKEQHRRQ